MGPGLPEDCDAQRDKESTRHDQLTNTTLAAWFPAAYTQRDFVEAGGLMSYGTDIPDMVRQVGVYTGQILKGVKPADLPILRATRFDLIINLTTAKALGLEVPPTLLARADEVIE